MRSIITAVVVILIIAGVIYYFYGYRDRNISEDINAAQAYTGDAATTAAVKSALALNKHFSSFDINVETTNNKVTLTGQVPTAGDRQAVEEVARSTKGVSDVVNNLQPNPKIQAENADRQYVVDIGIKAAVLESILDNPDLKTQQIKVSVEDGLVKLSGSVQTLTQKAVAESAVRSVTNVRNLDSSALVVNDKRENQP